MSLIETTSKNTNGSVFRRIYRGRTQFDFVGRRRWWFAISSAIIVAGIIAISTIGLNLGIEFKGGTSWQVQASGVSVQQVTEAMNADGLPNPTVTILGGKTIQVESSISSLTASQKISINAKVIASLSSLAKTTPNQVSESNVGATWGGEITSRALWALCLFFLAVIVYISFRFEPKMALAAFLAMVHDLLVTIGVYAIFGFQVTPDTVIAVLTILGYSLYDTVVVFDRVRDNVNIFGSTSDETYSDIVNLSMNQTLARSINTSLVAIIPVLSVLLVGAELLGAVTLLNYGVALFVGLLSGAYSSIFIAAPLLAMLKEREPRWRDARRLYQDKQEEGSEAGGDSEGQEPEGIEEDEEDKAADRPKIHIKKVDGIIRPGQAKEILGISDSQD